jgi:uncharacterized membrane protein
VTNSDVHTTASKSNEDRILRFWTPILLRTILIVAMIVLVIGLLLCATYEPGYLVKRYQEVQHSRLMGRIDLGRFWTDVRAGQPHTVIMLGLFILTLVPLARVAFCFLLFVKERDWIYVAFTAYVLAGLIVGVLIGSSG